MLDSLAQLAFPLQALVATLLTWALTALGACVVFLMRRPNQNVMDAVLGALLVLKIQVCLPFLLAFAAGAMIYVVVEELIPESQTNENKDWMALFTLVGFSVMMVLDVALG